MSNTSSIKKDCLRGGCPEWYYAQHAGKIFTKCERCGWDEEEANRRKKIPLTLCKDGLRRIIIPKKPVSKMEGKDV